MYRRKIPEVCCKGIISFYFPFLIEWIEYYRVLVSETEVGKEALSELARKFTKRNLKKLNILNELNVMLSCDDIISAQIYYNFIDNIDQLALAKKNIELLIDNGVSLEFVRTNAVVLILPNG